MNHFIFLPLTCGPVQQKGHLEFFQDPGGLQADVRATCFAPAEIILNFFILFFSVQQGAGPALPTPKTVRGPAKRVLLNAREMEAPRLTFTRFK